MEEPAIVARIESEALLPLGGRLRARLVQADPGSSKVLFAPE
ncbi:hypothetical protein C5F59_028170 [Streptomyces sp. QL37]